MVYARIKEKVGELIVKDYLRHKIFNVINIKGITAIEFLDFEGKYKNYIESHDFWELCYVKKGEVVVYVEEKRIELFENQLLLIPPEHKHYYVSDNDNQNRIFVVCFDSTSNILETLSMVNFNLDTDQIYCLDRIIYEAKNTFKVNKKDLLELVSSPIFGGKQGIMLQLEYLIICLVRQLSCLKNHELVFLSDKNYYSDFVNVVISFLKENVRKKVSLNDICDKMKCSRSFLCRIFKEQTGETVFSYFNKLKAEEVKGMLKETTMSISDISYTLGFDEVKYFDFFFKKYFGETPSSFRKKEGDSFDNNSNRKN